MDRKSIITLVAAFLVLLVGSKLVDHFFPPVPVPPNLMATNQIGASNVISSVPASNSVAIPREIAPRPSEPEQTLTISNDLLICHFTSYGGGLKEVELKKYPAAVSRFRRSAVITNFASLNTKAPSPVLDVLSKEVQGDNGFRLTQQGQTVRAEKTLSDGLRVVKEFEVGSNYLIMARLHLENTSNQALRIPAREVVIGTATPMGPTDDPTAIGTFWYNGAKTQDIRENWFANRTLGCFSLQPPRTDYEDGAGNVVWAAVRNQFFTLAAIPSEPAPEISIHRITLPPPEPLAGAPPSTSPSLLTNGYQTALVYPAVEIKPHQSLDRSYTFYAGPKEYNTLAKLGQKMNNNLDLIMGFSPPFGFFSKFLLLSMNGLHALGVGYGFAIIGITVIIRLIFWPLTVASTRSQKRMQAFQPQLKAIADKYKDDPAKKNQKTMEFMKEHKISPLGSCLPMMLQIPVFFGFYSMLRNAIELRGVSFLWAFDLSQPDTIAMIGGPGGFPLNPLPLVMGATQLWQAQLTPPSPGMDPAQQKIMRYMPLMFIAIFYKMSAGLTLYWTISNLLSIAQTKMTKTEPNAPAVPAGKPLPPPKKKK